LCEEPGRGVSPIRDSHFIGEIPILHASAGKEGFSTLMRTLALLVLGIGLAAVGPAHAQSAAQPGAVSVTPKGVVELFTSQGCSSCPAADALLGRLAKRDDVIAISLSVDYWDYLGWKDTLAQAKFSERQKAYAKMLGDGMVYTPQMVVNGLAHVNGGDEAKVERALDKTSKSAAHVSVRMSMSDDKLVVDVGAAPAGASVKEATIWLAVMSSSVEVPITRGENRGKTITYTNVVRELIPIGMWSGKAVTVQLERHTFMQKDAERGAVLVQQGKAGPIIGAALLQHL
jgi:hypothetical protein